jgi:RNA polymerase sigma-70 factor (ECF subfamily)
METRAADLEVELPEPTPSRVGEFDEFFEAHANRLRRLALAMTGSASVADELAQETMMRVLRKWSYVRTLDRPDAWATRVCVNLATSRGRRLTSEARALVRLGGSRVPTFDASADRITLLQAIRKLPKREAQAIALHYFDDQSIESIATTLECPESTVKTHLRRGRQRLALMLGDSEDAA